MILFALPSQNEADLDKVVGVLWLRDALSGLATGQGTQRVQDVMRSAQFVPVSRTVDDVLRDLQGPFDAVDAPATALQQFGETTCGIRFDGPAAPTPTPRTAAGHRRTPCRTPTSARPSTTSLSSGSTSPLTLRMRSSSSERLGYLTMMLNRNLSS